MTKKRVLFLCTGNSARSQMAEGLLRNMAGDRFEVFSAGTKPVGLNPNAVKAMAELGIDISRQHSKSVDEFTGQQFDYVFTVCDNAREACPIFLGGGDRIHHSFEDPAAAPVERQPVVFRMGRDQIRSRPRWRMARFPARVAKQAATRWSRSRGAGGRHGSLQG